MCSLGHSYQGYRVPGHHVQGVSRYFESVAAEFLSKSRARFWQNVNLGTGVNLERHLDTATSNFNKRLIFLVVEWMHST